MGSQDGAENRSHCPQATCQRRRTRRVPPCTTEAPDPTSRYYPVPISQKEPESRQVSDRTLSAGLVWQAPPVLRRMPVTSPDKGLGPAWLCSSMLDDLGRSLPLPELWLHNSQPFPLWGKRDPSRATAPSLPAAGWCGNPPLGSPPCALMGSTRSRPPLSTYNTRRLSAWSWKPCFPGFLSWPLRKRIAPRAGMKTILAGKP